MTNFNPPHLHSSPPYGVIPFEFRHDLWRQKTRVMGLSCGCLRDPTFSRFDIIPECDGHTDTHTYTRRRHIPPLARRRAVKMDALDQIGELWSQTCRTETDIQSCLQHCSASFPANVAGHNLGLRALSHLKLISKFYFEIKKFEISPPNVSTFTLELNFGKPTSTPQSALRSMFVNTDRLTNQRAPYM